MDLIKLRYFLTTAKEGNMSRAAELLHISQPTVSKQLKELEEELDSKLFERTHTGIRLTDVGLLLQNRAENILELVDKTQAEFTNINDYYSGPIYIGAAESAQFSCFADIISDLKESFPGLRYELYSSNVEAVGEKLDRGQLDLGIVMTFVDVAKYDYLQLPTGDYWGLYMRRDDPLSEEPQISRDLLCGLPLICSRQWMEQDMPRWFANVKMPEQIIATYDLTYNAFALVQAGMGYLLTYNNLGRNVDGSDIVFRPVTPLVYSDMFIVWRKNHTFSPSAKLVLDHLKMKLSKE